MALFRSTAEVMQYLKLDVNMKFAKLLPSIQEAEEYYLKPLLGDDFYAAFAAAYEAADDPKDLPAEYQQLLPYVQRTLAYYAMVILGDELGVSVGDLGIQQQANINSQPAPQQKISNLKFKYITSADRTADTLLEFLEENASETKFFLWYNDPEANTAKQGLIVYKTSIASKYIDINDSRRLYLRIRKRIVDIEKNSIKGLLCENQYSELITQIKNGTLTDLNKDLIALLEPLISKKALYLTLPSIAIAVEAEGLVLFSFNDSVVQKAVAGNEEKKTLAASLRDGDYGYEADQNKLQTYLNNNIESYPLIKDSPCWETLPTTTDLNWQPINSPCFKHYSV